MKWNWAPISSEPEGFSFGFVSLAVSDQNCENSTNLDDEKDKYGNNHKTPQWPLKTNYSSTNWLSTDLRLLHY